MPLAGLLAIALSAGAIGIVGPGGLAPSPAASTVPPRGAPSSPLDDPTACRAVDALSGAPLSSRVVAPTTIRLCQTARVTLTLRADCGPPPLDVAIVVDRSGSMVGASIDDARAAARAMIDALGLPSQPPTRAALVSHGDPPTLDADLTDDPALLHAAIDRLAVADENVADNLPGAIDLARARLVAGRAGDAVGEAIGLMLVLSDGGQSYAAPQVVDAARRAGAAGVLVVPVCIDNRLADCATMREIATRPEFYYLVAGTAGLDQLFATLALAAREIVAPELTVEETFPSGLTVQPIGAEHAPRIDPDGRSLTWRIPFFPRRGITLSYALAPRWVARFDLPAPRAVLREAGGASRDLLLPPAVLTVDDACGLATAAPSPTPDIAPPTAAPTESPTPAATPTPTGTSTLRPPAPIFLPLAYRDQCLTRDRPTDVVLIIDASISMGERTATGATKLAAAQEGARAFIERMRPGDQTAVIAFNAGIDLRAPLTGDRSALAAAVDGIRLSAGTRIDVALYAGAVELAGPRRRADSRTAIVLLTDGRPSETTPPAVLAAAEAARGGGAALFAIGVGDDVDAALLLGIAGDPGRFFMADDGEALASVYRQIGERIPCPNLSLSPLPPLPLGMGEGETPQSAVTQEGGVGS